MNIKNVLVPVDFSPPSRLAVDYAISLARTFRAKLTLMHVAESPWPEAHSLKAEAARIDATHREQALRMLSALVASEDQDDLDLRIALKSGDVKEQIIATIAEQQADVVVMGTHGRGFFSRLMVGSVTEAILRKVSIPVLTVSRATRPLAFRRILFASDLSEASKQGFNSTLDMARMLGSEVVLVHALDSSPTYSGETMVADFSAPSIEDAKIQLAEFAAAANTAGVKVEQIGVEGAPAEEILKAVSENEIDLVVITVGRKGLVERALLGATAEHVIRESRVPVLSIPADT